MADVYAFYGFKGGAGRSLVMAHVASMAAAEKKKVLMIDADLEAPGLGDFFDGPGRETFELWRGADGLMDVVRDLSQLLDRGSLRSEDELDRWIDDRLRKDGGLIRPIPTETAAAPALQLLGPGNHRASSDLGVRRYMANFLDFDWNAFLRQGGPRMLHALGKFWRGQTHGFDYILIDARTGYNLPSILLIQHWATHLVGVSTWSWQSIDGMARMLPVARRVQWQASPIPTFLVMNKTAAPDPANPEVGAPERAILDRYFEAGIERIELPYAYPLQAHDRMAWELLDWDRYVAACRRRDAQPKTIQEYGNLHEASDDAIAKFCEGISDLHAGLTGRESSAQAQSFRELFQSFSAASKFNDQAGKPEDEGQRRMTLDDALGDVKRWLTSSEKDSRDNKVPLGAAESFHTRGKEERALWRNALLRLVTEPSDTGGVRGFADEARLAELQSHFALDLDPSSAAERIAATLKLDPRREAEVDVETATIRAIRAIYNEPTSPETPERLRALEERAGGTGADAEAIALLRQCHRFIQPSSNDADIGADEPIVVVQAVCEAVRKRKPPTPVTRESFGTWSLFDLIDPLVMKFGEVLRHASSPNRALATALSELAGILIEHLCQPAPWQGFEVLASAELADAIRQRAQWARYVNDAVRVRLLSVPTEPALSAAEAAALRRAAALPDLESCADWRWLAEGRVTDVDLCAFQASAISLLLGSGVKGESSRVLQLAAKLLERALSNRMTDIAQERQAYAWSGLLKQVADLAGPTAEAGLDLRAARRSLRLLANNGVWGNAQAAAPFASWATDAVYDMGHRFSPVGWLKPPAPVSGHVAPAAAERSSLGALGWFEAVPLMDEGRYRAVAHLLDPQVNHALAATTVDMAEPRFSQLVYQHVALAELGRRDAALAALRNARRSLIAIAPGLGFPEQDNRATLALTQTAMLAGFGEDKLALQALAELDTLEPAYMAARGVSVVATLYRALLGAGGDSLSLSALVDEYLTPFFRQLPGGPDRLAAQAAGLAWHGSGLFCAGDFHAKFDRRLTRIFGLSIELAVRHERHDEARALVDRWARLAARRATDGSGPEDTPLRSHAAALIAAFRARLAQRGEREVEISKAWAHRQADLDANGPERAFAYRRIFALCAIG